MKIKIFQFFGYVILFAILAGCSTIPTSTPMSEIDKKSTHTVLINKEIPVAINMFYMDADMHAVQMMTSVVGVIIANKSIAQPRIQEIKELAVKNHISIDSLVMNQFKDQLNHKTMLKVVNNKSADAQLNIVVENYGLMESGPLIKELAPTLAVRAALVKQGKEIWSSRDYVTAFAKGTPSYTLAQIRQDPRHLYQMWNAAAEKLVNDMIKTI